MKIAELRYYLSPLSKNELETLIVELFKRNAFNKDLLETKIKPENEQTINQKYRKVIKDEFFPDRGEPKLRYSLLRKAINDYKKISKKPDLLADLMLYYVENGVEFTNEYGDIDEDFYLKIENMFSNALDYIFKHNMEKKFEERCLKITKNSEDIGWGFSDSMADLFYDHYKSID
jgi:hypothetical protein